MPTKNPRINITLSEEQNSILMQIAKRDKKSAAATARDLIEKALEDQEDKYFAELTNKIIEESDGNYISHEEAWK